MTKMFHNDVLDAPILHINANMNKVVLFDTYSTTYATINSSKLAEFAPDAMVASDYAEGRQGVIPAKTDIAITASGDFNHWAILDTDNSKVLHVGEAGATRALTSGDKLNSPQLVVKFKDPV